MFDKFTLFFFCYSLGINPFTAKYPSLEPIITKILAKKEKLVFKLYCLKVKFSLDSYENFEENVPNDGTVPRM